MTRRSAAVAKGAAALLSSQVIIAVAQFGYSAFTARVLMPEAFGALAVAVSASSLLALLVSTGLPSYVVVTRDLSAERISGVVTISWISGTLTGLMLLLGAPIWAAAWQAPDAVPLTRVLGLQVLFAAPATTQLALLRREGRAGAEAALQAVGVVAALSIGTVVVASSKSEMALAVSPIATPILTLLLASVARARRVGIVRPGRFREILFFASHVSTQNIVFFLVLAAPLWSVSLSSGAGVLGQFSRAALLAQLPANALTSALTRAVQPQYRHIEGVEGRRNAVTDAILIAGGIALPPFFGLTGLGRFVIDAWLGPGWSQAEVYIAPLAAGWGLYVVFAVMANGGEAHRRFRSIRITQVAMVSCALALVLCVVGVGMTVLAAFAMLIIVAIGLSVLVFLLHVDDLVDGYRFIKGFGGDVMYALVVAGAATAAGHAAYWQWKESLVAVLAGALIGLVVWILIVRRTAAWGVAKRRGIVRRVPA